MSFKTGKKYAQIVFFRHKERDAMKKSELDTLTHFGDYSALTGAKGEPKRKKKKVVGGKKKKR